MNKLKFYLIRTIFRSFRSSTHLLFEIILFTLYMLIKCYVLIYKAHNYKVFDFACFWSSPLKGWRRNLEDSSRILAYCEIFSDNITACGMASQCLVVKLAELFVYSNLFVVVLHSGFAVNIYMFIYLFTVFSVFENKVTICR